MIDRVGAGAFPVDQPHRYSSGTHPRPSPQERLTLTGTRRRAAETVVAHFAVCGVYGWYVLRYVRGVVRASLVGGSREGHPARQQRFACACPVAW